MSIQNETECAKKLEALEKSVESRFGNLSEKIDNLTKLYNSKLLFHFSVLYVKEKKNDIGQVTDNLYHTCCECSMHFLFMLTNLESNSCRMAFSNTKNGDVA